MNYRAAHGIGNSGERIFLDFLLPCRSLEQFTFQTAQ